MTSSVIRKYVLAALCGAAIVGVGQSAQAATWRYRRWCLCTELVLANLRPLSPAKTT